MGKNDKSEEIKERIPAGVIKSVATYAMKTMYLTSKDEENLKIFERRILVQKKEINMEHYGKHIVDYINAQRLKWFRHVHRRNNKELQIRNEQTKGMPKNKVRGVDHGNSGCKENN